ncbi:transketolase [Candidatus Woesearchaeota archaeon]|nr:transketolase [Candidatus Woesearchaeota archaeon]
MKKEVLEQIALRLRRLSLEMTTRAKSGHPTTCLSAADLVAALFFSELRLDTKNPDNPANDEFVLSKGHASALLWAVFAEAGIISENDLKGYRSINSVLEGHPTPRMPWVKVATGSLGQGLSAGLGMALAQRLQKSPGRVFVLMGDGELAEGSVWEAAALASYYKTKNLIAIADCNRLGQSGESLHGNDVQVWKKKFEAFGWKAVVIDGHNMTQILSAFRKAKGPFAIITKTIKGKGVSFLEDKEGWHGKVLSEDDLRKALKELGESKKMQAVVRPAPSFKSSTSKLGRFSLPNYKEGDLIATREAYGDALVNLSCDDDVVALDGDVKNSTFSQKFKNVFPQRFFDCFIAEQNMVGMATGFAARGFIPFVSTFAAFFTRAHDQIRMAGISGSNIKLCGSHVGVSIGEDGPSQMGLEDLAMMRSVPNSVVLYPSDAVSSAKCVDLMMEHDGLSYLRTSRPKTPVLYSSKEQFTIGGSKTLKSSLSDSAVVIAAGVTVHEALKAYDELRNKGVNVAVVDAYSVKPIDRNLAGFCQNKKVIVVEDHYSEGGLGDAVRSLGLKIVHLAVHGVPRSGRPEELLSAHKIDSAAIVKEVLR